MNQSPEPYPFVSAVYGFLYSMADFEDGRTALEKDTIQFLNQVSIIGERGL